MDSWGDLRIFSGNANPPLAEKDCGRIAPASGQRAPNALLRWRSARDGGRERPRDGCVPDPAHLRPRERQPDGAFDHGGCVPAGIGQAYHARHPLLWLLAPGQEDQAPRADHRPAGGRPHYRRRRIARARHRPARRPDPGLFPDAARPPLRRPPDRRAPQPQLASSMAIP